MQVNLFAFSKNENVIFITYHIKPQVFIPGFNIDKASKTLSWSKCAVTVHAENWLWLIPI